MHDHLVHSILISILILLLKVLLISSVEIFIDFAVASLISSLLYLVIPLLSLVRGTPLVQMLVLRDALLLKLTLKLPESGD